MLFNSIEFALFLPIVFIFYWFITQKSLKSQNFLIVIVSYIFYGWWDWRFLSLIILSSFVDYFIGLKLSKIQKPNVRKLLLIISLVVNLGILGLFKYFNFFIDNFVYAFSTIGIEMQKTSLNIILPVGISFYTFQTLSYTIDVYKRKLNPTKDIIAFFAFVSFFPQLVAGPIERATNLLPQFYKKRSFNYYTATDGMRQILWGLFKKIVIADNAAYYANDIFNNYTDYNGSTLILGAIFFAFQIYGDFSGYSDIAIGTAKLFGFNLMRNFAYPYFSRDIAEFWRRWHISLSTWFRDYVYIPLGGSKGSTFQKIRNIFIIFVVSGFWHGAKWTFIVWGALNAFYFLPLMLLKKNRKNTEIVAENSFFPSIKEIFGIAITFFLTIIAWIFFRSENVSMAVNYIINIFSVDLFQFPIFPKTIIFFIVFMVSIEWIQRKRKHGLQFDDDKIPTWLRWIIYFTFIFIIFYFGGTQEEFIYFQF
ncbi:MAG: MBOAT family protein [Bacteroidales bacterium]|nr:MBOAT family protein [Bacteroidales bacterium]